MSEMTPANDNVSVPEAANDNVSPGGEADTQQAAEAGIDAAPPADSANVRPAVTSADALTLPPAANDNVPQSPDEGDFETVPPGPSSANGAQSTIDEASQRVPEAANDNVPQSPDEGDFETVPPERSAADGAVDGQHDASAAVDLAPPPIEDDHRAMSDPATDEGRRDTDMRDETRWTPIDRAMAMDVLTAEGGLTREQAASYVESFAGQIWVGSVPAGETLVRYSDAQPDRNPDEPFLRDKTGRDLFGSPEGRFLGERRYDDPSDARFENYLTPFENNASVLRGNVTLGANIQTLVVRPSDWSFGTPQPLKGQ
jgi:hypothetical protein